jgi:transcriptional regulator with XRE-family HTH domain
MTLATRIRSRRKQLGLGQLDLLCKLRELGLRRSPPTLRDWEAARRSPRADELRTLARALETTVTWLVGEGNRTAPTGRERRPS